MKKIVFGVFLTILLSESASAALKINEAAPIFSLQDRSNRLFSLTDYFVPNEKSNGVILSFFASWCIQCRNELRVINSLADELNREGITVVIIGVKEDFLRIDALLAELKVDKPIVLSDPEGKVTGMYQVRFFPITFFISSDGKVKDVIFGEIKDKAELKKSAGKLLK